MYPKNWIKRVIHRFWRTLKIESLYWMYSGRCLNAFSLHNGNYLIYGALKNKIFLSGFNKQWYFIMSNRFVPHVPGMLETIMFQHCNIYIIELLNDAVLSYTCRFCNLILFFCIRSKNILEIWWLSWPIFYWTIYLRISMNVPYHM